MMRRPKLLRMRSHSGLYVLLACGAIVALLLVGLTFLGSGSGDVAELERPATPEQTAEETTAAERTAEEETTEETTREETKKEETKQEEEEDGQIDLASIPVPSSPELYLSVPKMGLSGDYVANSVDEGTLYNGAGHVPESGFPWQEGANTYIASHVLGYEGSGSYLHFAALPNVTYGDQIFLTDANGTEYTYEVYEILQVSIYETWVMEPVGGDVVSLQTCINPPAYDVRLVVRGKLVDAEVKA